MKSYRTNLFNFDTVKRPVTPGSLLVSEPFLHENFFRHAVVSMITVDSAADGSSMGVVLNNRMDMSLDDVVDGVTRPRKVPVFCGGPCSLNRLYFVHTLGETIIPGATQYAPGLWIGGDFDTVLNYVNTGYPMDGVLRFFLGYAGWERGQLGGELEGDVWAVTELTGTELTGTEGGDALTAHQLLRLSGDSLWHHVIRTMGPHYRTWSFHPSRPSAN